MITLEQLKARAIDPETEALMNRTMELAQHNIYVYRKRMAESDSEIRSCIYSMTHNGNNPKSNEQMLNEARMYIEKNVYTDEQWEQYFIPAINDMIKYNDEFVRWMPGYVIKEKNGETRYLVFYDYALAYGHLSGRENRDFTNLCLGRLDSNGEVDFSWAWADYNNYELIDKNNANSNINVIRRYLHNKKVPTHLCDSLMKLLYHPFIKTPTREEYERWKREVLHYPTPPQKMSIHKMALAYGRKHQGTVNIEDFKAGAFAVLHAIQEAINIPGAWDNEICCAVENKLNELEFDEDDDNSTRG